MKLRLDSLLLVALLGSTSVYAQPPAAVDVFKSPDCGCCGKWVEHMRQNGFQVQAHNINNVPATRKQMGMPDRLGSCHTAKIGAYVIEGHVPAADIKRLLKEKPKALGLAVPGMVLGSPGMEGAKSVPYETLLVQADGSTRVFAKH